MSLLPGFEQQTVNPTEEWILLFEVEESKDFNYGTYNSQNSINSQYKLLNDTCKMFTNKKQAVWNKFLLETW